MNYSSSPKSIFGVPIAESAHQILSAVEIAKSAGRKIPSSVSHSPNQTKDQTELPQTKQSIDNIDLSQLDELIKRLVNAHQGELNRVVARNLTEFVQNKLTDASTEAIAELHAEAVVKIKQSLHGIKDELQSRLDSLESTKKLEVVLTKGKSKKTIEIGHVHCQFETLLKTAQVQTSNGRLNVWLAGPAGSGKTTAAMQVAKSLDLQFQFNGSLDTEHKLLGFIDAQGRIVSRPFRQVFSNGGIYLFDEIDASLPSALLAFNAALANGYCDFPDKLVKRHPDCVIIAGANTYGSGASGHYIGRNKQDGAFLDRFVTIEWDTDENLELLTAPNQNWTRFVQAVRKYILSHGIHAIVSPRASYFGSGLLEQGLELNTVINMSVKKGIPKTIWDQIILDSSVVDSLKVLMQGVDHAKD